MPGEQAEPVAIQRSLELARSYMGAARPDSLRTLRSSWVELVGAALASTSWIQDIRDGVLVVHSTDPATAEELSWAGGDLVAAANSILGTGEVDGVRVRVVRPGGAD